MQRSSLRADGIVRERKWAVHGVMKLSLRSACGWSASNCLFPLWTRANTHFVIQPLFVSFLSSLFLHPHPAAFITLSVPPSSCHPRFVSSSCPDLPSFLSFCCLQLHPIPLPSIGTVERKQKSRRQSASSAGKEKGVNISSCFYAQI